MFQRPSVRTMAFGLAFFVACGLLPADAKKVQKTEPGKKIVIVHTNDLHGNIEPDSKGRGGLTKIATLLNKIRKENPKRVLYIDAGDVAQGTPISNTFHGEPMYAALKAMGPVAGTLGNHEFDWGCGVMEDIVRKAGYPILVGNIYNAKTGKPFQNKPYRVVDVDGVKVGIVGLITEDIPSLVKKGNADKYRFEDPCVAARRIVPKMVKDGAEVIVAVTHIGVDVDKRLAAEVPDIDLIVGGHSHTKLAEPINIGGHTWIVQSDKYGRHVGVVEMLVSPTRGKILGFNSRLVQMDDKAGIEPDPVVTKIVNKYNEQVRPLMEQQVGKTDKDMKKAPEAGQFDSALGNVICDAMRAKTNADIAAYNNGGIRDDVLPGGVVTRGTIFKILPFDDQVVTLKMKGSAVQELMDQAARSKVGPLQTSGIECKLDKAAGKAVDVKVNGKALDPNADYIVATTEFLSGGGDDFKAMEKGTIEGRFDFTRDVFIDYLDDFEVLEAPATGRVVSAQ